MIEELSKLPSEVSFQIRKHSSKTITDDIRDENFVAFLINYDLINQYETRNKYKTINKVIYSCRIGGKKGRFFYALDLDLAIKTALEDYYITEAKSKSKQTIKQINEINDIKEDEARIHRVLALPSYLVNKRKGT